MGRRAITSSQICVTIKRLPPNFNDNKTFCEEEGLQIFQVALCSLKKLPGVVARKKNTSRGYLSFSNIKADKLIFQVCETKK